MAKSDIAKNGKIFFKGNKYRQNAFKITMSQIECAERKKMPEQKGIRQIVLDEYKQRKREGKRKPQIAREGVEQDIVAYFVTDAELSKSKAKVCVMCDADEFDVKNGKHIGMFLNLIFDDLLDEMKLIVKKYKSPIIDFKVLRAECQNKGREFLGLM